MFLGKKQKAASRYGSPGSPPAPREEWAFRIPNLKHTFVSPGVQASVAFAWDVKSLLACKKSKSLRSARKRPIPRQSGGGEGYDFSLLSLPACPMSSNSRSPQEARGFTGMTARYLGAQCNKGPSTSPSPPVDVRSIHPLPTLQVLGKVAPSSGRFRRPVVSELSEGEHWL